MSALVIAELRKNARERIRVSLDEWRGHQLLDLRVCTQLTEGTDIWSPTKKGLSVNVSMIGPLRMALAEAEHKARELGLLGGEL